MTNEQKIIRNKVGLVKLAETLGNISQACKVMGYSRDSFCGSPRKSWDAKGNISEVAYSSTYKYAYPTLTTSADPDGAGPLTAQTSSAVYDLTSGAITSQKDANNQTMTMEYAATDILGNPNPLRRLTKVNRADGGWTAYAYGDQVGGLYVETWTALDATRSTKARREFDGLGREWRQVLIEGATSLYRQTQYDSMGRVWKTSNPYRTGQTVLWTTKTYDALGRVLSVKTPDNAQVTTSYSGNQVTVTDQAGKTRRSVTDALGNLIEVYEDPAGVNYLTSYTYDALGNLKTVTQGAQTRTFVYDSLSRLTSATNPESGTITYQYDANGNLTKKVDPRFVPGSTTVKIETTYTYDALNRVTSRSYTDSTPDVTYTYDAAGVTNSKGRLTRVSSSVSMYDYTAYDEAGRVTGSSQTTNGQTYQMGYAYDLAGNLVSQTYPSGRVVTTAYDDAGRLSQVSGQKAGEANKTYATSFSYTAHGAVSDVKLGNNLWEHTNFNNRLQPIEIGLGTVQDGVQRLKLNYTYGTTVNNGNVLTHTITVPTIGTATGFTATQSYSYDELNRLESAQEANGAIWKQTFVYDRYGNRTFDTANTTTGYVSSNLTINATNNRYNTNQGQLLYDAAGNLTKDFSGHTFGYDGENHQVTYDNGATIAGGASYSYDGDGRRVKKVTGGITIQTTVFVYNALGQLVAEYDDSQQQQNGGTSYLTMDTLGTPRIITDSSGGVKARHDYLPFGEEIGLVGGRTAANGYITDDVRQKFTGKERDDETGLDYFLARYYSNTQGRFMSTDPMMASAYPSNPQSWNRYTYVLNNPLNLADPNGMESVFVFSEYNKLTEDERRILDNSAITFGKSEKAVTFTKGQGEDLYNYMKKNEQKQLAGFLNLTAGLADIKFSNGRSAISYIEGVTGVKKGERIYANVDSELHKQMETISTKSATPGVRFVGPSGQETKHEGPDGTNYDVTFRENIIDSSMQLSFASTNFGKMDMDADEKGYNCNGCSKAEHAWRAANGADPKEIYKQFISRPKGQEIKPSYTIEKRK